MPSVHPQVAGNINSFNSFNSFNNIFNFIPETDTEGRQILQWLSPLEPQQRHQGVRADRLDGVGNWVLETNEFRKWGDMEDSSVQPVLFCYGNPGVGKTYLSSLVIDRLCDQAGGNDIAVVGLYCDFLAQQEQSTPSMLGSILKQLVSKGRILEHIREAFRKAKKGFGGRGLRPSDLVEILGKTIASIPRVFICIDALDESASKHRRELLGSLREITRMSPNTRIFLTGRSHINDEIAQCFGKVVRIPISPTQDDIESYLEMRLDGDTDPRAMDDQLRADIMRVIPKKISEIFLLVSLNVDAILGEFTLHQRRKKLDEMGRGEGLGDAYAATLSRVKAQQRSRSKLAMEVLMWVSYSERPLHVDELCHALGVEEGSCDLNIENIPAIETLLACTLGLVTVEKSSSTVRLVHYTLQEYLSHNPNLFLKPHAAIAEVCLTYLNFRHVRSFSPALRSVPTSAPFATYASCYWGAHARRETTGSVRALALKLLDGFDTHISSKMLLLHETRYGNLPFDQEDSPRGFTGLHGVAYLGCAEIAVALLEMNKWDVGATDFDGNTPIAWAARRGHEGVVRILLERNGVNPNAADTRGGRTPLLWASGNGHQEVVRLLLARNDVDPETPDARYYRTPLSWAAENGHGGIVGMLLEHNEVNPDAADARYYRAPLSWAAENGHESVVRALLARNDVSADKADKWSRTALSLASENGHDGIVGMLLERNDVNPNTADTLSGRTPLLWALGKGHKAVVRTLLGRINVDPNTTGAQHGRTLLSWAAEKGIEVVVRILLGLKEVKPDKADKWSRTALSRAAENGHGRVVGMLLEQNNVNPGTVDARYGRTPLSWAAENGHEGVVRILLERNDVDPNTTDTSYGRTPLLWAAANRHEGAARVLLERDAVDPNIADRQYGRTPLSWAAGNGSDGTVRMLLKRGDVDPNTVDTQYGRTPLLWAVGNRHEGVVGVLLERNDVNSSVADARFGLTPLSCAVENGYESIAKLLQERAPLITKSPASPQSTDLSSTEPAERSSKRARRIGYPMIKLDLLPSTRHLPSGGTISNQNPEPSTKSSLYSD